MAIGVTRAADAFGNVTVVTRATDAIGNVTVVTSASDTIENVMIVIRATDTVENVMIVIRATEFVIAVIAVIAVTGRRGPLGTAVRAAEYSGWAVGAVGRGRWRGAGATGGGHIRLV